MDQLENQAKQARIEASLASGDSKDTSNKLKDILRQKTELESKLDRENQKRN